MLRPLQAPMCNGFEHLRPTAQFVWTDPVVTGAFQAEATHPDLTIFPSAPEVRALPSTGITRHQRSYDPVRHPLETGALSAPSRPLPSPRAGLPRLPALPFPRAVPTTPADRTGACVDCFPVHTAFPATLPGRHPHCAFRGLLRLHSHYGPRNCSAAQGGLCHEASTLPVTRQSRSSATRSIDNSLDGTFLHG